MAPPASSCRWSTTSCAAWPPPSWPARGRGTPSSPSPWLTTTRAPSCTPSRATRGRSSCPKSFHSSHLMGCIAPRHQHTQTLLRDRPPLSASSTPDEKVPRTRRVRHDGLRAELRPADVLHCQQTGRPRAQANRPQRRRGVPSPALRAGGALLQPDGAGVAGLRLEDRQGVVAAAEDGLAGAAEPV